MSGFITLSERTTIDTMALMDSSKVAEFYADMMEKQATQFTILISVLCVVVAGLTLVTLWWNIKGAKQQIAEESENNKRVFQRLFKATTSKMEDNLKIQLETEVKSLSGEIHKDFRPIKTK